MEDEVLYLWGYVKKKKLDRALDSPNQAHPVRGWVVLPGNVVMQCCLIMLPGSTGKQCCQVTTRLGCQVAGGLES